MASRNQPIDVPYIAWNTNTNTPQVGDVSNHTLRWWRDGIKTPPTNASGAYEIDQFYMPGVYVVSLTQAEANCKIGALGGISSTAGVRIYPVIISFEQLPSVDLNTVGGLPTLDASGALAANVTKWLGTPPLTPRTAGLPRVDVDHQVRAANADGLVSFATSTTFTFPESDGDGNPIPDDSRYNYAVVRIVSGTGVNQIVLLGTKQSSPPRTYAIVSGANTTPDTGSGYRVEGTWRSRVTDSVQLDMTQAVPTDGDPQSLADALNMALANAAGKIEIDKIAKTMTVYARDNATVARVFALDNVYAPLLRE